MALLTSCWFIIESIVIPDGFLKWFYLSFYIHPLLLFLCQIFLWLKLLKRWLFAMVCPPLRNTCFVVLCIVRCLRNCLVLFFSLFTGFTDASAVEGVANFDSPQSHNQDQIVDSYSISSVAIKRCKLRASELKTYEPEGYNDHKDSIQVVEAMEDSNLHIDRDTSMNEFFTSDCSSNSSTENVDLNECSPSICSSDSPASYLDMNEHLPSFCSSNLPVMEREVTDEGDQSSSDPFYKKYTERMRWFDILNYDRTCGISAILNKQLGTPGLFEGIKPTDFSIPYISWSKMAKKRLLKSLESDFEMVYVAQTCLTWEALHHQYTKVQALAFSSPQNGVFYNNVAGEFQKFQVLLERFMEDERCHKGKRFWNYVQGRFSFKSLLQVPEVSGFSVDEKEGTKEEAVNVKEVLNAIEKCIKTFWAFVKTDNKKSWWKFSSSLWTCPPVEDPRDLELLADLTKKLQKELRLKDLQGKERCWLTKVANHPVESQQKEILFTMIDKKLISRVLQMSMISSSQLKWCQEKLNNMEFREGKVVRACTDPLFPP